MVIDNNLGQCLPKECHSIRGAAERISSPSLPRERKKGNEGKSIRCNKTKLKPPEAYVGGEHDGSGGPSSGVKVPPALQMAVHGTSTWAWSILSAIAASEGQWFGILVEVWRKLSPTSHLPYPFCFSAQVVGKRGLPVPGYLLISNLSCQNISSMRAEILSVLFSTVFPTLTPTARQRTIRPYNYLSIKLINSFSDNIR